MSRVTVGPLPAWLDAERLLGAGAWTVDGAGPARVATAELSPPEAADLSARLRGLGFGGEALTVEVRPKLPRALVRAARTDDARRRRDTTPGFTRPGTRLDDEGRMSLTPEVIALAWGRLAKGRHVLDAGCGAGGNAIGFARAGCRVTAVERDAGRLALARHNAAVYGAQITFVHGDAVQAAAGHDDLVFVDPPWGAEWDRARVTVDDLPLLSAVLALGKPTWAKVPPSFVPPDGADVRAVFGEAPGDRHRVKCLLVRWGGGM